MWQLVLTILLLYPMPESKMLDWSIPKAFANDSLKLDLTDQILKDQGRKQCGKKKKCWLPAFFPFPQCFQKFFFLYRASSHHNTLCDKGLKLN